VKVFAPVSPRSTRPIPAVPVFAVHAVTIAVPSRYRLQLPAAPIVPQSSIACQPVPSATPDRRCVPLTSDLTNRMPLGSAKTRTTLAPAAERSRRSASVVVPMDAAFTRTLAQIESNDAGSVFDTPAL
jgi:hypothetical protein